MFKKFMALFTWWKSRDRGDTLKTPDTPWPRMVGHNPRPAEPASQSDQWRPICQDMIDWARDDIAKRNRRVQPEQIQPFNTGTPHSRMHDLIIAGKPDALIAIELGVDLAAVRNYRHIISAPGRVAARKRAAEAQVPRMLARGELDVDIASKLGLDLATVKNVRDAVVAGRRREAARYERVPAALLRQAQETSRHRSGATLAQMDARAVSSPLYDPNLSQSVTAEGCARVRTTLDELARIESQCPAPADDQLASGQGGDFGGAGATGSWAGEQP